MRSRGGDPAVKQAAPAGKRSVAARGSWGFAPARKRPCRAR